MKVRPAWDEGIRLKPTSNALTKEGEIKLDSSSLKFHVRSNSVTRTLVTEDGTATLTNKTIDANGTGNSISNLETADLAAGVLNIDLEAGPATDAELPSALAVQTLVAASAGDAQAALDAHINDTTDAHDASAISNVPSGNLAATDVQGALNELQTDVDTRALDSALQAHINDTTDAHDASAISNVPSGNLAATDVQGALNELQSDIDTRVTGPASATDNAVTRFDLTTGKLVQNSVVTIGDTGATTGISTLNTSGLATLNSLSVSGNADFNGLILFATTDDTVSGANATVGTPTTKVIRLTNASLTSIDGIPAAADATEIILENVTGVTITVNNETGATAGNRILTGTGSNITLFNNASLLLSYDNTSSRWRVISNLGATGGSSDLSIVTVTTTYSIGNNDNLVLANATSGAFTVTLPTAVGITGRQIRVFKTDSTVNRVTIATTSSQTINGSTTQVLGTQYDVVTMVSDGANWVITSNEIAVAARYTTAGGQTVANAIVNFGSLTYDSHNAVTTGVSWKFTAPMSGKYRFSGLITTGVTPSVGDSFALNIYKNGSSVAAGPVDVAQSTTTRRMSGHISGTISLAKGDFIDFRMSDGITPAATLELDGERNYVQIERVGN